jgi:hypothetical protein
MEDYDRVPLWDAINDVVVASGGSASNTSVARQKAVVLVERAVDGLMTGRDQRIAELEREKAEALRLRSFDDWHEDHGCGLWWREPVSEPPYAGAPGDSDWPWPKKDSAKLVWIPCPNPSSDRRATEDVTGD